MSRRPQTDSDLAAPPANPPPVASTDVPVAETRQQRVARLVRSGQYNVPSKDVAERLMERMHLR